MNTLPEWNRPGKYSMGRDPLGMQAASVRLYTQLVPGVTNVTNRIRYYSFYCWVIGEFEKLEHSSNEEKWKIFIRRAEAAYVLSCVAFCDENSAGMAGSDWAREHSTKLSEEKFDFTEWTDSPGQNGQYLKASRGNFGQFYIASMIDVGMLVSTGSAIPLLTQDYGVQIARAFEKACPKATVFLREAIVAGGINAEQASQIADEANPAALSHSTENEYLKDFLLGRREDDATALGRRESLWNCLNALNLVGEWDIGKIRTLFYTRNFDAFNLNTKFENNLNKWQAYQANELCHIALELLLNDISHEIQISPNGIEPKTAILQVLSRVGIEALDTEKTLRDYSNSLALSTSLNDDCQLGDNIILSLSTPGLRPDSKSVQTSLNMLCLLFSRWRISPEIFSALDPKANFGRSLASLIQSMEKLENNYLLDALSEILRKFIVKNHLHIAGQKLANSGTFTYRFLSEDGLLKDVRLTEYNFTTPRLSNLLWFAEDVGLIAKEKLTAAGNEFLNAH